MSRRVLALLLATLAAACATPREAPLPMANNSDRCADLEKRAETEERARERLAAALLACRLDSVIDAAEATRILGASPAALDVRGDNVVFLARASASEVKMTGTLTAPMERIAKTDLWAARFRFQFIDYAMLKIQGDQLARTEGARTARAQTRPQRHDGQAHAMERGAAGNPQDRHLPAAVLQPAASIPHSTWAMVSSLKAGPATSSR